MDPLLYPQIRALQAIVREYQHPLSNEPDENVKVVMKSRGCIKSHIGITAARKM